ncbi:hypothetical protein Tco_0521429, partial [Tanacetum coccineum]
MGWNNISNSLFVGGAYGIAGAGLGTSPELIGPGVNRIGAGPELNCTGAICSVSSLPTKIPISAVGCNFPRFSLSFVG